MYDTYIILYTGRIQLDRFQEQLEGYDCSITSIAITFKILSLKVYH